MTEHKTVPFELTKVDTDGRTFEGYASTFRNPEKDAPDLTGDMVVSGAFKKSLAERGQKVRMLWQHDPSQPIGKFQELREDQRGLYVKGLVSDTRLGRDCLALLKDRAIDSMSIGYDAIPGGTEYVKGTDGKSIRLLKEIRLWEVSLVTFPADEQARVTAVKGVIPFKATEKAPEGEAWSRPALQDFTDKGWGDLTDAEKRAIASHYAWSDNMPPATFGDLKLPHHRPSDGAVVWMGVANSMARMNQAAGIDMPAVRNHLLGHYDQFDKPHPGEASAQPVQAFKAADIASTFAQQLSRQGLWEARWQIESAFDQCIESILSDEGLDGAAKLGMLGESCQQYGQALGDWAARVIAVSGKSAGEPSEVKAGRRLSAASTGKIRAALAALSELLGEPASYDPEPPAKDQEKSIAETETPAPGPEDTQVADEPPSAKAGPGTEPPTASEAVGTDVAPPTSSEASDPGDPFADLERQALEIKRQIGWR